MKGHEMWAIAIPIQPSGAGTVRPEKAHSCLRERRVSFVTSADGQIEVYLRVARQSYLNTTLGNDAFLRAIVSTDVALDGRAPSQEWRGSAAHLERVPRRRERQGAVPRVALRAHVVDGALHLRLSHRQRPVQVPHVRGGRASSRCCVGRTLAWMATRAEALSKAAPTVRWTLFTASEMLFYGILAGYLLPGP